MKSFCLSRDIVKKMKRYVADWKKMISIHITNKAFARLHEELSQFNNKKNTNLIRKKNGLLINGSKLV